MSSGDVPSPHPSLVEMPHTSMEENPYPLWRQTHTPFHRRERVFHHILMGEGCGLSPWERGMGCLHRRGVWDSPFTQQPAQPVPPSIDEYR